MSNLEHLNWSERKRLRNEAMFAPILQSVSPNEQILAVGTTNMGPIAITDMRAIRAGHEATVSIPFADVERAEHWLDGHRWTVRLFHAPIDPRPRPANLQWWRFLDRRKEARESRRRWRITEFRFSHPTNDAAEALRRKLLDADTPLDEVAAPRCLSKHSGEGHQLNPTVKHQ